MDEKLLCDRFIDALESGNILKKGEELTHGPEYLPGKGREK
jgi:hypothetical protein